MGIRQHSDVRKRLVTLTGPSYGGKTTLVRKLQDTGHYVEVLSFTSRKPRSGEVEGVDYYFKTEDDCRDLVFAGKTAEHIEFKGNFYGIEKTEIDAKMGTEKIPVVIVEPNGLSQLKEKYDCFSVYLDCDLMKLYERFLSRFRMSLTSDVKYEAKRVAAIRSEHDNWKTDVGGINYFVKEYTDETEAAIIAKLLHETLPIPKT